MHYASLWHDLKKVTVLEKLAEHEDTALSKEAQLLLASTCDKVFSSMKKASANEGSLTKQLMAHRDAHRVTGEKLAAAPELTAELLQKIATAEYVDDLLETQLEKLSGAAHDNARMVQLLGREYAVNLMRGLFA